MDSDRSSLSLPAGKIRRCACGKGMSGLKFDFHTVYSNCQGLDYDLETCCVECADISDVAMSDYVSHKLSLKRKLLTKHKLKAPLPPSVDVHEPVVVVGDLPLAEPSSPGVSPALVTSTSDSIDENQSGIDIVIRLSQCLLALLSHWRLGSVRLISVLARLFPALPPPIVILGLMSAVRIPLLTVLLQLQLQWPCVLRLPPCRTQTTWEPP